MAGGPGPCLQGYELQLMDASARLYPQRVHERSFSAFEASGMVLLQKRGASKTTEATLEDVPVLGWSHLTQIHEQGKSLYQLYPRRARTTRAFEAMLSMCNEPGSPFRLTDRYDPVEVKFVLRAKEIDTLNEYNQSNKYRYNQFNTVYFDGILASQKFKQVAFLMTQPNPNMNNIMQCHQYIDFLRYWIPKSHQDTKGIAVKLEALLKLCNDKPFIICAGDTAPPPDALRQAVERGMMVMHRQAMHSMKFLFIR
eukprot:PhF_6_TR7260/c0_g1_i1/m.10838